MSSKEQIFSSRVVSEPRWLVFIKRSLLVIAAFHLLIGLASTYRAFFQIHSVEIVASDLVQHGSVIQTKVVTSGRVFANVKLELIQNARTVMLGEQRIPKNELGFYDPRPRPAALSVTIMPQMLDEFVDGPATLRATAVGTPQFSYLPPPVVREVSVQIRSRSSPEVRQSSKVERPQIH